MKIAYLIHGWEGNPDNCWFPWLKQELIKQGYTVTIPSMPNPTHPTIKEWVDTLNKIIKPDPETILIGHSIGCQAILRYLESLNSTIKFAGIFFVGGWVTLKPKAVEETGSKEIAKPWLETPLNWQKIFPHSDNVITIFSTNDYFVYVEDSQIFKEKLHAKVIIEENQGHFDDESHIKKIPSLLREIALITELKL